MVELSLYARHWEIYAGAISMASHCPPTSSNQPPKHSKNPILTASLSYDVKVFSLPLFTPISLPHRSMSHVHSFSFAVPVGCKWLSTFRPLSFLVYICVVAEFYVPTIALDPAEPGFGLRTHLSLSMKIGTYVEICLSWFEPRLEFQGSESKQ